MIRAFLTGKELQILSEDEPNSSELEEIEFDGFFDDLLEEEWWSMEYVEESAIPTTPKKRPYRYSWER